jgi:hypothetical protein
MHGLQPKMAMNVSAKAVTECSLINGINAVASKMPFLGSVRQIPPLPSAFTGPKNDNEQNFKFSFVKATLN